MFTGIVECTGILEDLRAGLGGVRVVVSPPDDFGLKSRVDLGDSIACNGVCLTAAALHEHSFEADVSAETLERTAFGRYRVGQELNLELACTPQSHLGGHFVLGHVDGVGRVLSAQRQGESLQIWVSFPAALSPYLAVKGSVAVDGISLTVNALREQAFRLDLIPHTQERVRRAQWQTGTPVNLEVDVIARYLERLMLCGAIPGRGAAQSADQQEGGSAVTGEVTAQSLLENGFF